MFPRVGDSLKAPLSTVVHQFDTEYLETVIFLLIRCALWRSCWLASGNFIKLQVAWVTWLIITFGEDYNPIQFWGQYVLGMGVQMGMMCYSTRYSSYKQVSLIQVQGLAIQIPQWFVIKPCPQPKAWYVKKGHQSHFRTMVCRQSATVPQSEHTTEKQVTSSFHWWCECKVGGNITWARLH